MQFEYPLLEALATVVREGTFAAAATALNITQSAVSQRVRLLEERTGAVLIVRGRPCVATEYGQQLCRHIEQVQLLEYDLRNNLSSIENTSSDLPAIFRVAVNRDSLATWFPEVIRRAGYELKLCFDIYPDDQEHTAERLRNGEVLAAVTNESDPPHGCRRVPLGALDYLAVATPGFVARNFREGLTAETVTKAPCIVFDRKDTLPRQWLVNAFNTSSPPLSHWLPSFSGYLACCLNGAGWGMMPRFSVDKHIQEGSLVELMPSSSVILPLYWQSSASGSEIMRVLSTIVIDVARRNLLLKHGPIPLAG